MQRRNCRILWRFPFSRGVSTVPAPGGSSASNYDVGVFRLMCKMFRFYGRTVSPGELLRKLCRDRCLRRRNGRFYVTNVDDIV